jgi:hypothetical protein
VGATLLFTNESRLIGFSPLSVVGFVGCCAVATNDIIAQKRMDSTLFIKTYFDPVLN